MHLLILEHTFINPRTCIYETVLPTKDKTARSLSCHFLHAFLRFLAAVNLFLSLSNQ